MNEFQSSTLPFTVLGGFLGSGKTTLLNRLLNLTTQTRYAVLVNDFGELNIDEYLIARHDGETIALTNGCMCCSMADGFVSALTTVMDRADQFDQIVVEASGVSNPRRIMDIAKLDPGLSPNGVIVLVDAPQFLNQLTDSMIKDAVLTQVKEADILLISKANLTNQSTLNAVRETLDKQHSDCTLLINDQDDFDPRPLFDSIPMASSSTEKDVALVDTKATSDHGHVHTHDQFHSCVLQHSKPLDRNTFESWATALPPSVIRGKGVISFTESPHQQWIWQKVGRTCRLEHSSITPERSSKVVLIATEQMPTDTDPKFYGPFSTQ
jgi:G3E family GTPase